jgi:hypothetical protein
MFIGYDDNHHATLANVDSFLKFSQGNNIIVQEEVYLDPYWYRNRGRRSDADWEGSWAGL